jgi:hypothetical protein
MVVDVSPADGFSPVEPPRVAVAGDGTLAAIHESSRVTILELPGGAPLAEVGVDPEALASDVAWVGAPPRLLVLSRYAAHSTVHLVDPFGPVTLAEIRLESPMRLFATVGPSALAVSAIGAAVVTATESHLMPYQFPTRVVPVTAGAAAAHFLVALAGSIEEWDPQSRTPRRRLRLPRAAVITAVGGSERLVWVTTQQEPARIDVIPLINRGQPRAHDLPEPIARVSSHPRSDLVACIGASIASSRSGWWSAGCPACSRPRQVIRSRWSRSTPAPPRPTSPLPRRRASLAGRSRAPSPPRAPTSPTLRPIASRRLQPPNPMPPNPQPPNPQPPNPQPPNPQPPNPPSPSRKPPRPRRSTPVRRSRPVHASSAGFPPRQRRRRARRPPRSRAPQPRARRSSDL